MLTVTFRHSRMTARKEASGWSGKRLLACLSLTSQARRRGFESLHPLQQIQFLLKSPPDRAGFSFLDPLLEPLDFAILRKQENKLDVTGNHPLGSQEETGG